jgi:hypothetical protein
MVALARATLAVQTARSTLAQGGLSELDLGQDTDRVPTTADDAVRTQSELDMQTRWDTRAVTASSVDHLFDEQ